MRKVILSMMVSVDGFIEGPNQEQDWFTWDEEMESYMINFFRTVDTFIYGRKSYEVMVDYWPNAAANPAWPNRDQEFVDIMNNYPKIILSKTLDKVEWNATLIKDNIAEEITKIKKQPGKDLALFAGAETASTFIDHNLIDEYRLIINPVVIGSGQPLFKDLKDKLNLNLLKTETFPSGIVILYYQPNDR